MNGTKACLFLLLACRVASAGGGAPSPREIVRRQCGACHDPRSLTAIPKALAIFDLERDDWAFMMTDTQMDHAIRRLRDRQKMSAREIAALVPKGVAPPPAPAQSEVDAVLAYFALSKADRAAR